MNTAAHRLSALDLERLGQALVLAEAAVGLSEPNPRVGCVIGRADGTVVGSGHTQRAGEAHAEIMALRDARSRGADTRGCTAWVTLEPCSHHGRTGPCCEALAAAGLARVVIALPDPNPRVNGRGAAHLRSAGIEVEFAQGDIAARALALNIGFVSRMLRGRPWLRMKLAASLDGRTALPDGRSQWITDAAARADGHMWRRRAGAILTGVGTVLADDPQLNVRHVETVLQPMPVVLDSRWRTPTSARILRSEPKPLILGTVADSAAMHALQALGASCLVVPEERGRVALPALLDALAQREVNEVHVEAGPALNGALLDSGCVDELLIYQAPKLLGKGAGMADITPLGSLADAPEIRLREVSLLGTGLRMRGVPATSGAGLPEPWLSIALTLGLQHPSPAGASD